MCRTNVMNIDSPFLCRQPHGPLKPLRSWHPVISIERNLGRKESIALMHLSYSNRVNLVSVFKFACLIVTYCCGVLAR